MKSLIKYIYYPPLSKHFFIKTSIIHKEIINKEEVKSEEVKSEEVKSEEVKSDKNIDYCNIWIRKNF